MSEFAAKAFGLSLAAVLFIAAMAKLEKQFDDELKKIIKEDKPLKAPKVAKQTKQKENNMKQFIKKPITIVVLTVALTLAAVYASYSCGSSTSYHSTAYNATGSP